MNALDSPLEALALNYLSLGFLTTVNVIWPWVAVITAAVSVWRIRASSPRSNRLDESTLLTCFSCPPSSQSSSPSVIERVTAEPPEAEVASPSKSSAVSVFQREGRTSGKFIVYYPEDREEEDDREDCGNDAGNDDVDPLGGGNSKGEEWLGNGWEVVMMMKMGDMGWYRYQDSTMLDGNVVRLWNGCRRRNAAPSMISCGGGEGFISC